MNKIKICLLTYDLRSGGAERVISQWSILLQNLFDVYITTFRDEIMYPYAGTYTCLDVKDSYVSPLHRICNVVKRARALRKFVKKNDIDIVLSFCNECNLANTVSFHKAIKICSIRSASDLDTNTFVKYVVLSKKNRIIIQTEALKKTMLDRYGNTISKKLFVYGNPFDVSKIKAMSMEQVSESLNNILNKHRCLINVGSFKGAKNHANLLKSFEIIANEVDDVFLILVGANLYNGDSVREMAKKSKFADRIIFTGETTNPFAIESKCSIFVFPSLSEGIPNALAEAMIVGLPVISSNCPTGPAELLSDTPFNIEYNNDDYCNADYGVLVKPFSCESDFSYDNINDENIRFAKPIIKALKDQNYYDDLKRKAERGATRFDIESYKNGLVSLINLIADEK